MNRSPTDKVRAANGPLPRDRSLGRIDPATRAVLAKADWLEAVAPAR